MNQLITKRSLSVLAKYDAIEKQKKEIEKQVSEIKKSLYKKMSESGTKSIEINGYKFTLIEPKDSMTLDTDKLKEEGIYDLYCTKKRHTDGYVRYTSPKGAKA